MLRNVAAACAFALVAAVPGCAGSNAASQKFSGVHIKGQTVTDVDVSKLMAERAHAITNHDEKAWLATVDQTNAQLVAQQQLEYRNLTELPLSVYRLVVQSATPPNFLSSGWFGGSAIIREETQVAGVDHQPVGNDEIPFDINVQNKQLVITDDHNDEPWARTQLDVRKTAHFVIAVDHRNASWLSQLTRDSERALSEDRPYFASRWLDHYLVFATSDRSLFNYDWLTGGGADFIGYVTSFPQVAKTGTESLKNESPRVVIDLDSRYDATDDALTHVLRHEFTHAASTPDVQPVTPTWILEGYAEYVASAGLPLYDADVYDTVFVPAAAGHHIALPDSYDAFYTGDISTHYELAFLAFRFMKDRYGVKAARNFYVKAQGGASNVAAAFKGLGLTESGFVTAWNAWAAHLGDSPSDFQKA